MTPDSDEQAPNQSRRRSTPPVVTDARAALKRLAARTRSLRGSGLDRSPWVTGPIGAVWAAGIGLAIAALSMVLVWVASPASGLGLVESLRTAGILWVVAHGTPVAIGAVAYSLLPWGLAVVPVLLLGYAGGWSARRASVASVRQLAIMVASATFTYAVVVAAVAALSVRTVASVPWPWAAVHAAVVAVLAFGWGAGRASRDVVDEAVPSWCVTVVRSGAIGAITILAFGAVAAAAALTVRVDDAVTMAQSLHGGVWGGLGLLLLGLAYLPVFIVWSSAYVVGAGFAIGPAVVVSPFIPVTSPTQLPPFPLLAAVPQTATPVAWALPALGVVAGVVVGLSIARSSRSETRLTRMVLAFGAAAVSGLSMGVLASLADGALGDVRLAHLGPSATTVGVLVFILVLLGAVPSAVVPSPPVKAVLVIAETAPEAEDHDVTVDDAGDSAMDRQMTDEPARQ
jgi:hypothetical protein